MWMSGIFHGVGWVFWVVGVREAGWVRLGVQIGGGGWSGGCHISGKHLHVRTKKGGWVLKMV